MEQTTCKKCGIPLSVSALRRYRLGLRPKVYLCHSCYMKGSTNHSWKGGPPKCLDCKKQLVGYRHKRCKACSVKWISKNGKPINKNYSYDYIHLWLKNNYGKASCCENKSCSKQSIFYEWAKRKGKRYTLKRENFIQLCRLCHRRYDWHKKGIIIWQHKKKSKSYWPSVSATDSAAWNGTTRTRS